MQSLTWWITPFTGLSSLDEAIATIKRETPRRWSASLLLPTHFGPWAQAECRQSIPSDMLVSDPADVAAIRDAVERAGVGFGAWGVPVDQRSASLASAFASASGYYSANFEPAEFWTPGDDPAAIDAYWTEFWNAMPDQDAMNGNVSATVVPNGWGLGAFANSLPNLVGGCNALALEVYGGLQTQGSYPFPNLWPTQGFDQLRARGVDANLIPILARVNLASQLSLANRLGHGNVHVWAI